MPAGLMIAAPASEARGSSAAITGAEDDGRISVTRVDLPGLEGIPAYSVRAAPGLIALIAAHGAFGPPPDLVLSGVNRGANVGRAILHSGTVGAALTGGLHGARGLAVSLDAGLRPITLHWGTATAAVLELLPRLLDAPDGTVINVNAPNAETPRGIVEARLAEFGIVQTTLTERAEHHIRLAVEDLPSTPTPGSDAALLAEGWVTVTGITPVSDVPFALG